MNPNTDNIHNVLMNPGVENPQDSKNDLIKKLNRILSNSEMGQNVNELKTIQAELKNTPYANEIEQLIQSAHGLGNGPKTLNPTTNKPYPTFRENLIKMINKINSDKIITSQVVKKKKKTRGNPFRVLMGKVGKLLDHGLERKEIVRYLLKEKHWSEETIENAVAIVKKYNKKKKTKGQKKSFNLNSFIKTSGNDTKEYGIPETLSKRTIPELISRLQWLKSVDKDKNAVDKTNVKKYIRDIQSELRSRNYPIGD